MRIVTALVLSLLASPMHANAEVTGVTIASRSSVADGQAFGRTGSYEKVVGTISFALDPTLPQNKPIVDLGLAPRDATGKVRFTADLYVLRPADASRGNGMLLFEVANRGRKGLLTPFNGARPSADPSAPGDFGDGYLLEEGYTIVWVGWEFDTDPPLLGADLPIIPELQDIVRVTFLVNEPTSETSLIDEPVGRPAVRYPPVSANGASDTLTVRDRFWDRPTPIPRDRWRFAVAVDGRQRIQVDGGIEPGRIYEIAYRGSRARPTGAAFAIIRDTASAMRYQPDFPIKGRAAMIYGASQSGRFLREFLHAGFNADEHGRRVFDAVWPHIAGAALGSFNARFLNTTHGQPFLPTRFPFTDAEQPGFDGKRDGLLIEGPRRDEGRTALPFLVPQVDADGNELAGIRVPDQAVPLATVTGWNFRATRVGNPSANYWLLGSYVPFPSTPEERQRTRDPRRSVTERYSNRDDYLQRVRAAADGLVKGSYLLERDLPGVLQRAEQHWSYSTTLSSSKQ